MTPWILSLVKVGAEGEKQDPIGAYHRGRFLSLIDRPAET